MYNSKYLGGSAIFPKYSAEERCKSLIQDTRFFAQEKLRLREKIENTWQEVRKITQPYLFDPKINTQATLDNPPSSRGCGFRVGASLITDSQAEQDCLLRRKQFSK